MTSTLSEPVTVLRLCGTLELEIAGEDIAAALPGGQATALFACLALSGGPRSRDELIEGLWPGATPSDPQGVLSTLLSRLRRVLGADALPGRSPVELTLPPPAWIDVEAAHEAVQGAREALAASNWTRVVEQCQLALDILELGFLPGHDTPWIDECRRDLEDLHLAGLELEGRGGLALGEPGLGRSEHAAKRLIAIAPYREVGHRLLMETLERSGNVAEALRVYERLRALLRDELGTAPARELRTLHERLLADAAPDGAKPGQPVGWSFARPRPAPIAPAAAQVFVGREHELDQLEALRCSESRGLIPVAGEPGIGKTRLVSEFVRRAEAGGALVLYGRCDEETLVPYQPFIEGLRGYVARCPVEQLRRQVRDGAPELSRILPALRRRLPDLPEPPRSESESDRFRLFELVAAFLSEIDASAPLVLVLDDIHWADRPTLLLLRHLLRLRDADGDPPLIIATYRTTEIEGAPSELLAELHREGLVEPISLAGLGEGEVSALMAGWAGTQPPPELARAIHGQTAGNPFFVEEFLRHLAEAGAVSPEQGRWPADLDLNAISVPAGVKQVVGRRLSRVAPQVRRVLRTAAVIGARFGFDVLERLSDLSVEALAEALEEAAAAQLIVEEPGTFGAYSFSHALIRESLHEELTLTRRVLLHRRIGEALEELYAGSIDPHLAELAHHFYEAAQDRDPARAIDYGERAGRRAVGMLAYEEAARHYERALQALELAAQPREARRCELLIGRGEAERLGGDPAYRETLIEAARLAQELGDGERLGRAALANNRGFFSATAGVDRERVSLLELALEADGTGDSPTRASLLAQLAAELVADPDWLRRAKLSDDALAIARRVGDPRTLLRTLNYRFTALWGPRTVEERLANCDEAEKLADRLEEPVLAFQAANFGFHAAMEAGALALADRRLDRAGELAGQLGQPIIHWYYAIGRAKRSLICGAPAAAEKLARVAFDVGRSARQPDAFAWFMIQLAAIRFLDGTHDKGRPNFLKGAEAATPFDSGSEPTGSRSVPLLVEAANVVTFCEVGRTDDARARFDGLMRDELADLPHDWAALAIPALASIACAHLDDARRAHSLYAMLEPHASQFVDAGPSWFGTTSHHLALLAATLGRLDEADARLADAADAYEALGAEAWLARGRLDRARSLVARSRGKDLKHAEGLLSQALEAAQELGLEKVEQRAVSLLEKLPA